MNQVSLAEKVFLVHGARLNIRADGRARDAFRPISIDLGILDNCNGSARVRIGETDVLTATKAELTPIEEGTADSSRVTFSVDFSVVADVTKSETFQNVIAEALTSAYDNEFALPSLKNLEVPSGHMWKLYVDTTVLSRTGGALIDAISIAAKAAIGNTCISSVRLNEKQVEETGQILTIDASTAPIIVTVSKLGAYDVVDATRQEEACVKASIWIGVAILEERKKLTFVHQLGSLDRESIREMLDLGIQTAQYLHNSVESLEVQADDDMGEVDLAFKKHALLLSF